MMFVKSLTVLLLASMAVLQLTRAQGGITDCTNISDGLETAPIDPVTGETLKNNLRNHRIQVTLYHGNDTYIVSCMAWE